MILQDVESQVKNLIDQAKRWLEPDDFYEFMKTLKAYIEEVEDA